MNRFRAILCHGDVGRRTPATRIIMLLPITGTIPNCLVELQRMRAHRQAEDLRIDVHVVREGGGRVRSLVNRPTLDTGAARRPCVDCNIETWWWRRCGRQRRQRRWRRRRRRRRRRWWRRWRGRGWRHSNGEVVVYCGSSVHHRLVQELAAELRDLDVFDWRSTNYDFPEILSTIIFRSANNYIVRNASFIFNLHNRLANTNAKSNLKRPQILEQKQKCYKQMPK